MSFPVPASIGDGSTSGGRSCVPSVPSGLAVGDLMIGVGTGDADVVTPPAGWTALDAGTKTNTFWKIAVLADLSGLGTFTWPDESTTLQSGHVAIARIPAGTFDAANPINAHHATNASSTNPTDSGITPSAPLQTTLILLGGSYNATAARTAASYAVANSNPSWTEDVDTENAGSTGARHSHVFIAHAGWGATAGTATGNASMSFSGAVLNSFLSIVSINPPTTVLTAIAMTITVNSVTFFRYVVLTAIAMTSFVNTMTFSAIAKVWRNLQKSAESDWNNTPKS